MPIRTGWIVALMLLALALLGGCGGNNEPSVQPDRDPVSADVTAAPTTTADPILECETDAVATFPATGEVSLQEGVAVALGGPAYTIFVGDYDVPIDGIELVGAKAGPGEHLAMIATTVFNASGELPELQIGVPIRWTGEFGVLTFSVLLNDEGDQAGNNMGAAGTLTVTDVSEASICVEVDYSDEEKSVRGTIAAVIV